MSAGLYPIGVESRAVLAAGSRTFSLASRLLPSSLRDDAAVVYALCRRIDDLADDAPSARVGDQALTALDEALAARRPRDAVERGFLEVAARRRIDVAHARELIAGVRSDLGRVRVQSEAELVRYAYRVAGTVGLMMCGVLGVRDRRAPAFAIDLGVAMQLTNIARDVLEDARLGRVYLPADWLEAEGLPQDVLLFGGEVDREALARVTRRLLARAEVYYASADLGLRFIPFVPRLAILVASRVYRAIGRRLLRRGADPLEGRVVVPAPTRALIAASAMLRLANPRVAGLAPAHHDAGLHAALVGCPGADGGAT